MTDEVQIAATTGYAGTTSGPAGALIELAMHQAVMAAFALGIADDTPPERVAELTGGEPMLGSDYIRAAKIAARQKVKDDHRALVKAHEGSMAAGLHGASGA